MFAYYLVARLLTIGQQPVAGRLRPQWCPALHTIQGNDPSGPVLVAGEWHVFVTCDAGPSWGHYSSKDLVHWTAQPPTNWDSATGSVAPITEDGAAGFVAFWPNTTTPFPCCDIEAATTTNRSLQGWRRTGLAIPRPTDLSLHQGFRDPHRPVKLAGKWRMGVGSGSGADNTTPLAGRIRWFTATDDTLSQWTDSGTFFEVNTTVAGYVDASAGVVWNESWRRPLDQIECPDVFVLDGFLIVLGSLQFDGPWQGTSTTWWIGQVSADGTRFQPAPEALGLCDYGQNYAARHGEGLDGRRVLFGFSGWNSPTLEPGCGSYHGMYHLFPRELRVGGKTGQPPRLQISPVAEIAAHLRHEQLSFAVPVPSLRLKRSPVLGRGSALDIVMTCSVSVDAVKAESDNVQELTVPTTGQIALEVLADPAPLTNSGLAGTALANPRHGAALVVGYDFAAQHLFVDHSRMGNATLVQTAPLPRNRLNLTGGNAATPPFLRILVDHSMIESFGAGEVSITSFVTPAGHSEPGDRMLRVSETHEFPAELTCNVSAWTLQL